MRDIGRYSETDVYLLPVRRFIFTLEVGQKYCQWMKYLAATCCPGNDIACVGQSKM